MPAETTRQVQRDGTPIALTAKEFDPLSYLMRHPRQVLGKAQILGEPQHGGQGAQPRAETDFMPITVGRPPRRRDRPIGRGARR